MDRIRVLKSYIEYIILCIVIVLLFVFTSYECLNNTKRKLTLTSLNNSVEIEHEVKYKSGDMYLNIEDCNKLLESSIFFDKVSRKIIFTTTSNGIFKENLDNDNVINDNSGIWYNVQKLGNIYSKELLVVPMSNTVILLDNSINCIGKITSNNVSVYYEKNKKSIYSEKLQCENKVQVLGVSDNKKWINVIFEKNSKKYFGYIFNENISYENKNIALQEDDKKSYMVMLVSENNIATNVSNANAISIDIMKTLNASGKVEINDRNKIINISKKNNLSVYACINNGFTASNYDNNILSLLFKSDESRQSLIDNIIEILNKKEIHGLIVDFKNLKFTDKEIYTQFIKELYSCMHKEGLILGVRSNLKDYIDTESILKVVDFGILELYNERVISSNVSGTHSSIYNIKKTIEKYIKYDLQKKIILEIPMYSILWSEKNNIVVDSSIYSALLAEQYIKSNKLKKMVDKKIDQNYIEYKKGTIIYKMWLEDEYVLKNKIKIVKQNNLRGISLYKSGYETDKILEVLNEEF